MPTLQLVINLDPSNGQLGIGVNPPEMAGNLVTMFGMLELAKVALTKQAEANERRVQPVSMMPPPFPGAQN